MSRGWSAKKSCGELTQDSDQRLPVRRERYLAAGSEANCDYGVFCPRSNATHSTGVTPVPPPDELLASSDALPPQPMGY